MIYFTCIYKCFPYHSHFSFSGVKMNVSNYAFDYFVYVSIGVVFATLAGMFVTVLAPYAAGSGIPEVSEMMVIIIDVHFMYLYNMILGCLHYMYILSNAY